MRMPITLVLLLALGAAQAQDDTLPQADALPPPEMDDPGVVADVDPTAAAATDLEPLQPVAGVQETTLLDDTGAAAAGAPAAPGTTAPVIDAPLPEKVQPPGAPPPEVTIRTDEQTGDVIEEYRQNGTVYMVRVRPERGAEYLLIDTNGDGRLDASDGEGPVRPVYWTLYEWE